MPTKPSNTNINPKATAADVVNSLTAPLQANTPFAIPRALNVGEQLETGGTANRELSLQTLRDVGEAIVNYEPLSNAFLSALINRIGKVIITSRLYQNPWAGFKKGIVEYGESVEELFVNIIEAQNYDPERAQYELHKRHKPDVRSVFHVMNFQKVYPITVTNAQLRQAFLSFDGISNLITKIVEAVRTSANFDEFLVMKYLVALKAVNGNMYADPIPTLSAANSNAIVTVMKTISDDITELASEYNAAGVFTHTQKTDQFFIMTNKFANTIDVETLAFAFNLDKVELMGRIIRTKSFGFTSEERKRLDLLLGEDNPDYTPISDTLNDQFKSIPAVCIDREFIQVYDNLIEMGEQRNALGLEWNYFYHQWKTFSTSIFMNAIVFTEETPAVTSVTLTPDTVDATRASRITFNFKTVVTGFANGAVSFAITGNTSNGTRIDQQGRLTIAKDEVVGTKITVTATSLFDGTKSGTAEVTIV